MNRDDVIRMAVAAGALQVGFNKTIMQSEYSMFAHELEVFAALVAAAEREACAKVCDDIRHKNYAAETDDWIAGTEACAEAIRAREQA